MAFNVVIQRSRSDVNVVNKSITDLLTVSGVLKSDTSIIDPVIVIEADLSDLRTANYMHISAFGRYYYINDIVSVKNGLIEISAHVDVLMTYRNDIKDSTAIIRRQEKKALYNLYLNDGALKVYQNPMVLTRSFPHGFSTQEFVLAVAGK